jgi:hypothetical protein
LRDEVIFLSPSNGHHFSLFASGLCYCRWLSRWRGGLNDQFVHATALKPTLSGSKLSGDRRYTLHKVIELAREESLLLGSTIALEARKRIEHSGKLDITTV